MMVNDSYFSFEEASQCHFLTRMCHLLKLMTLVNGKEKLFTLFKELLS